MILINGLQGYLPANIDRRQATLDRKREEYHNFVKQYYPTRHEDTYRDTFRQVSFQIFINLCVLNVQMMEKLFSISDTHWYPKDEPLDSIISANFSSRGNNNYTMPCMYIWQHSTIQYNYNFYHNWKCCTLVESFLSFERAANLQ